MAFLEAAQLCRDTLVIQRSEALIPLLEKYATGDYKEWALNQVRDYMSRASWNVLHYPLTRSVGSYTALDWPIFGPKELPELKEPRERVADLLQIVRASEWPLIWYDAETHAFSPEDDDEICQAIENLHTAFKQRDSFQVKNLTAAGTFFLNDCRNNAMETLEKENATIFGHPDYHVTPINWDALTLTPRFDSRIVTISAFANGKIQPVFSIGPDPAGFDAAIAIKAVRSRDGWVLGR